MKFQAKNNYLINWPEYPLLRITICFISGIVLSDFFIIPLWYNVGLLMVALGTFLIFNFKRKASLFEIRLVCLLILIIGISIGTFRGNLQINTNDANHFVKHLEHENYIVGEVISEFKKKKRVSTTLAVKRINNKKCRGKLLVYFSKKDSLLNYELSDIITLRGKIQLLKDNVNPNAFNYKDYLKYKGIDSHIFLKDGEHKLIAKGRLNLISDSALRIRKWALSIFERRLNDKDELAMASAMVLGYREHLSQDLYSSFSDTGAVHVLAVSGLHVGIICMIFIVFFNRFKSETNSFKTIKLITLLSVVWVYALVTGASPAVLRASVMFTFILVGRLWFRGANIYNILAFSALVILMYDPYLLFQLSFQFSYLALISIVYFQPHIEKLYETKHWITTKIWQLTTVSVAAQILIFPISIFYFHKFPTYFILSGIAAVFLATFILGLGLLLLGLNGIPLVGDIISIGYSKLLEIFIKIISGIQSLPYNKIDGIYISKTSVVVLYILIGAIMFLLGLKPSTYKDVFQRKLNRKRLAILIVGVCILLLFTTTILFTYRIKNQKELIVYDISNGTTIDIFVGTKLFTFQSDGIEADKIDFAAKSYRIYNGNPECVLLSHVPTEVGGYFRLTENGSLIFRNKHILLADKVDLQKAIPCSSDVLLVSNKTELLPYKILGDHITSLVVLDNSLSFKVKNQWIKQCEKEGIDVHDVRKDGVFRL